MELTSAQVRRRARVRARTARVIEMIDADRNEAARWELMRIFLDQTCAAACCTILAIEIDKRAYAQANRDGPLTLALVVDPDDVVAEGIDLVDFNEAMECAAAFVAAIANNDTNGAASLWALMDSDAAIRMASALMMILGAATDAAKSPP